MVQESIECIEHTEICNDTNKGLTYFFRINGVEVYTKGGNLVPMDYYPSRMNQNEELEWLIYLPSSLISTYSGFGAEEFTCQTGFMHMLMKWES
jgi:hypothetical protein